MLFIGDLHGNFKYYRELVEGIKDETTIQLGDFGLGFPGLDTPPVMEKNHHFIRGNHDCPNTCRNHFNYLGDYGYNAEWNLFWVGGADSIDKHLRTEGVTWWKDEQLDYGEMVNKVIPLYEKTKPRIMVTHTCPKQVKYEMLQPWQTDFGGVADMTENALQAMFEIHQPDLWVFAHWHRDREIRLNGCRFICVNALQMIEVEL